MKRYFFFTLFLCFLFLINWIAKAQTVSIENNNQKDVETIDNIISTFYSVISDDKGQARDWDRFRSLFLPDARLIPSGRSNADGQFRIHALSVEDYIVSSDIWFEENGFFEKEIFREEVSFSHLTHVTSTYESRYSEEDEAPLSRGVKSLQLFHDGFRWWIVNVYWATETKENPIPEKYLPQSN